MKLVPKKQIFEAIKKDCQLLIDVINEKEEQAIDPNCSTFAFLAFVDALDKVAGNIRMNLNGLRGYDFMEYHSKEISSDTKKPLAPDEVENKETPFFQKRVVITGSMEIFPDRQQLASTLKRYGADINTTISGKTDIVIMGEGAGPSKMKKIEELQAKGKQIEIFNEEKLVGIFAEHNIN